MDESSSMEAKFVQLPNALQSMIVTVGGIVMWVREEQPSKAPLCMVITDGGITISAREVHR